MTCSADEKAFDGFLNHIGGEEATFFAKLRKWAARRREQRGEREPDGGDGLGGGQDGGDGLGGGAMRS